MWKCLCVSNENLKNSWIIPKKINQNSLLQENRWKLDHGCKAVYNCNLEMTIQVKEKEGVGSVCYKVGSPLQILAVALCQSIPCSGKRMNLGEYFFATIMLHSTFSFSRLRSKKETYCEFLWRWQWHTSVVI